MRQKRNRAEVRQSLFRFIYSNRLGNRHGSYEIDFVDDQSNILSHDQLLANSSPWPSAQGIPTNPDTRDALIRCGTEILTEQGFMATGIDGVLKTVGVPKGSFYHYFDSKEDFGRAVMDNYAAYFANKLKRWFLDDSMTPLQRVLAFVEDAKGGMEKYQFRRGCLVGNLSQEVTILPAGFREHLDATLFGWQQQLATCLREAQDAGELARHVDCAELAAYFWIGWEGAVLRARLVKSTAPLNTFVNGFMAGLPR